MEENQVDQPKVGEEQKPQEQKTFTQEQVNGIASKEAKQAQEKMLRELGFEDFDNAKDGLEKYKEWQKTQQTEQEQLAAEVEELKNKRAKTEAQYNQLLAQNEALKLGADPERMDDLIKLAMASMTEDATLSEVMQSTVEKYPIFLKKETTKPYIQSAETPNAKAEKTKDPFEQKKAKYRRN